MAAEVLATNGHPQPGMLLRGEVAPTAAMGQHGRYEAIVGGVAVCLAEERLKLLGFSLKPPLPFAAQPYFDVADHCGIFGPPTAGATEQRLHPYFEDRSSAFGESPDAEKLEVLGRYEVHLGRKLERDASDAAAAEGVAAARE